MWVYLPGACSRSAPDTAALTSPSNWRFRGLARSAMWRSKRQSARIWFRRWKKWRWTKLLCSRMPSPSTASRGVERWIASLRAIHASPSLSPADVLGPAIHVTSGQLFAESLMRFPPPYASSRTSNIISIWDSKRSFRTWREWITALRSDYSRRLKSGRAIYAGASSSWPTSTAGDGQGAMGYQRSAKTGKINLMLPGAASAWPTPRVNASAKGDRNPGETEYKPTLQARARLWGTPKASDGTKSGQPRDQDHGNLPEMACKQTWATPATGDHVGTTGGGQVSSIRSDIQKFVLGDANREGRERPKHLDRQDQDWPAAWPPGPEDLAQWSEILAERPELCPAIESSVCGMVDGLTSWADQVRSLGNGVVPVVGALAFSTLWHRLRGDEIGD